MQGKTKYTCRTTFCWNLAWFVAFSLAYILEAWFLVAECVYVCVVLVCLRPMLSVNRNHQVARLKFMIINIFSTINLMTLILTSVFNSFQQDTYLDVLILYRKDIYRKLLVTWLWRNFEAPLFKMFTEF